MEREPKNSRNGLGVANSAAFCHALSSGQRREAAFDELVVFRLCGAGADVARQKDGHGFIEKARTNKKLQNAAPAPRGVSGLFQKFALRGVQGTLPPINLAGGQLPK